MATVSFNLKSTSSKESPIIAFLTDGRDYKIKLYPGFTVPTKQWSKKYKTVLPSHSDASIINKSLAQFKKDVLEILIEARDNGVVRKEVMNGKTEYFPKASYYKSQLERLRKGRSKTIDKETISFWNAFDQYQKSIQIKRPGTIKKIATIRKHLEVFEKDHGTLSFDNIDENTLDYFQQFCYEKLGTNTRTTSKYIGSLKTVLNWFVRMKFMTVTDYQYFKPITQEENLKVVITHDELNKIREVELSKPYLENVRKLFILSCLTGLRYSDYTRIDYQHLKKDSEGNDVLLIRPRKNGPELELIIDEEAYSIVKELLEGSVHSITNQRVNEYVKELLEIAKVNEPFEVFRYVGTNSTCEIKPKYKLVTSHTGRRTFATNYLQAGVSAEIVMQFTGHKDYASFKKYVNIPKDIEKNIMREAMKRMKGL